MMLVSTIYIHLGQVTHSSHTLTHCDSEIATPVTSEMAAPVIMALHSIVYMPLVTHNSEMATPVAMAQYITS